MVRLLTSIALLLLSVVAGSAAQVSAAVTLVGGESGNACSNSRSDGTTASCQASYTTARGSSISSWYPEGGRYIWLGALHRTQSAASLSLRATARAFFTSEFAAVSGYNHGVQVAYDASASIDLEPVNVYVNDGFGDYQLVGTLEGNDSLSVPYAGHPIDIELEAISQGTGATDYVSLFHLALTTY